jgi:anaerobic magnesium-protoporphyrin IX monomethyl ester cyclase
LIDEEANPFIEFFDVQVLPRLRREAPASIGISVTYVSQLIAAFTLARMVRQCLPQTRIVVGGSYLTATAPDVMRIPSALLAADAIILHDGEEALDLWLHAAIRGHGSPKDVPNICLPSNGKFDKVGNRPPHLTELAALPVPMWTALGLDLNSYLVPKYAVPLPLTRGCHWGRCAYCNISSQQSGQYRVRDVDQAIADMRAIVAETGSNWFDFPVDSFHPDDLLALARAIVSAELGVEWAAEVLLDARFTENVVEELSRSGCRCLRFGLESACLSTLKTMRKASRPEVAASVLGACKKHGIRTGVMLIAGFPTETQTDLLQTYDFLVGHHHQVDFIGIHPFSLVPGSPMARDPASFGLYLRTGAPVLTTSLPFTNTNPVGMQHEDLARVIETMKQGLRDYYPDLGKLWTAAIGGWMTFPACCVARRTPSSAADSRT